VASATDICNLALLYVGEEAISLADNSATASACNLAYVRSRRALLASHPWNFARKVTTLAETTDDPAYGFTYCYALPTGCLRPLELTNTMLRDGKPLRAAFKVVGRTLLTDVEGAKLAYTADETDVNRFSESFMEALAWKMAPLLAGKLSGNANLQKNTLSMFQQALAEAKALDASINRGSEPQTILSVRR